MSTQTPVRYQRTTDGVHAVVLDGGALVWDERSETLHRLNESAAFVWDQCQQAVSTDDLVAAAQARHGNSEGLPADVGRCVRDLTQAGLLEIETRA